MRSQVNDLLVYRWRYILSYVFVGLIIAIVVAIASIYVPGALRSGEMNSALQSGALSVESLDPLMVIDLPYHILQRLSFMAFGVSIVSIKLPSILLGLATILGVYLLVRTWFRRNVAVLTTAVAATSTQFLFLLQDGTPNIMFSFLTVWLLFAATYVTRKKTFSTFWKVLAGILMATSLYTPLGIYLVLAVLTTAFFHPHIRHLIRHFSRPRLWIGVVLGVLSAIPVAYASFLNHDVLFTLVGIPTSTVHFRDNLVQLFFDLFGFASQTNTYFLRPIYSLGLLLLVGVGLYKLFTYKYTARSYIVLTLGLILVPLILFNPRHVTHLFPLVCLMVALGLATLITDWYKLFPRNPYARVAGLIPLSILVLGVVYSGVTRYMNAYLYSPDVLRHYTNDLRLIDREVQQSKALKRPVVLVASRNEVPFYSLVAHYSKSFSITSDPATTQTPSPGDVLYTHDAYKASKPSREPTTIITSRMSSNSDRLYIYKSDVK